MGPMARLTDGNATTPISRRSLLIAGLATAATSPLIGCAPPMTEKEPPADKAIAKAEASRAPAAPLADSARSLGEFSGEMLSRLVDGKKNLICSPLSVATVLGMIRNGAAENTAAEIDEALGAGVGQVNSDLNAAALYLAGAAGKKKSGSREGEVVINLANAVWGQQDFPWSADFLKALAASYGTGVQLADLAGKPEDAVKKVNEWVADQTDDEITRLLDPADSRDGLLMVLVNALLFRAQWATKFADPFDHPFKIAGAPPVNVPTLKQSHRMKGGTGEGWRGCMIPYVGGEMAMTIILADTPAEAAVAKTLAGGGLPSMQRSMTERTVTVQIPEFKLDTNVGLTDMLKKMGMESAFSSVADFTSMTDDHRHIDLSEVVQQATITVDQEGTSAAAATAAIAPISAPAPSDPLEVIADRPFWFFITDADGRIAPLFAGRLGNPAAKSD